jgi:hypothetical protein
MRLAVEQRCLSGADSGHYPTNASRFRAVVWCRSPPRAVRILRAFSSSAIALTDVVPPACNSRIAGNPLAARASAASRFAAAPDSVTMNRAIQRAEWRVTTA